VKVPRTFLRARFIAVVIAAAFFTGSIVAIAVGGVSVHASKKKVKRGPAGPPGPPGPQGAPGANGATNVVIRETASSVPNNGVSGDIAASCNLGEKATGGGVIWNAVPQLGMEVVESYPSGTPPTSWIASVHNTTGNTQGFRVRVICASP